METPMSRCAIPLATVALIIAALPTHAQNPPQDSLRIAASSFVTVEVHLNARPIGNQWYLEDAGFTGPARIAISYGQPHARGRKVEGGLIPNDNVWRFGANAATTLHTDVDITLGTLALKRGDYSLFLQHQGANWSLIVNSGTGQWGTDRDAAKDIGRVAMTARSLAEPEESLTIYLVPDAPQPTTGYAKLGGVLRIKWGVTELRTPWTVSR
jgi:hypothetical protein